jgi:hypothetical protein
MIHESCIPHMFAQITTPRDPLLTDWHDDKLDAESTSIPYGDEWEERRIRESEK